ncbi:hypothetical protein [Paraburkholderia kirstenboschensis]|uniref:hypothetical protein n=1 Tax=Paraburkholderia kirstenboschensis TaxID=1245436 RepID=UPI0013E309AF|nr:hypothetical protein [Paraburkholderia kirstenboschensis]
MGTVSESAEAKVARPYRRRTPDGKRQSVEETLSSGRSVAEIAESITGTPISSSTGADNIYKAA